MATLTETAYIARKGINLFFILLVLVIILRIVILTGLGLKDKYFPPPPPPATVAFGKLPYPNAQNNLSSPSGAVNYTIETVDGSLPTLPVTMKVYFIPKAGPSFGSFDKMKVLAAKMQFIDIPVKTGPTMWRFTDRDNPLRLLDIDEITQNFRLTYNYLSDQSLFGAKNFDAQNTLATQAQSFFDGLGLLSSDLQTGVPQVHFLRFDSGALGPVLAISDADAASVTLNRADISDPAGPLQKFPVVSPDAGQGLVSILFSTSGDPKKKILEARYLYSSINQDQWATYPIIKSADAFAKLKTAKAIFASLPSPMPSSVAIRQIFLAYLDPYPAQNYLQPVLVFSDQKGFEAYVPVIDSLWLQ